METAVVGIVGALIGVLLSNALRLYFDWRNRSERIPDMQTALQAEIRSHRGTLEEYADPGLAEAVLSRLAGDDSYTPFGQGARGRAGHLSSCSYTKYNAPQGSFQR